VDEVAADRTRGLREEIAGLRVITSYFAGAGGLVLVLVLAPRETTCR